MTSTDLMRLSLQASNSEGVDAARAVLRLSTLHSAMVYGQFKRMSAPKTLIQMQESLFLKKLHRCAEADIWIEDLEKQIQWVQIFLKGTSPWN